MPTEDSIPFGFCHCGCGQRTNIIKFTQKKYGHLKGQPMRFIVHHKRRIKGKSQADWLIEAIREPVEACLLWPFYANNKGYGEVLFEGRTVLAHRASFYLTNGRWPITMGCHKCDVPLCFNPHHIFEGNQADNMGDAAKKLRQARKLTPEIVSAIRREYIPYSHEFGTRSLAKRYKVHQSTIFGIVIRRLWKHIP